MLAGIFVSGTFQAPENKDGWRLGGRSRVRRDDVYRMTVDISHKAVFGPEAKRKPAI